MEIKKEKERNATDFGWKEKKKKERKKERKNWNLIERNEWK